MTKHKAGPDIERLLLFMTMYRKSGRSALAPLRTTGWSTACSSPVKATSLDTSCSSTSLAVCAHSTGYQHSIQVAHDLPVRDQMLLSRSSPFRRDRDINSADLQWVPDALEWQQRGRASLTSDLLIGKRLMPSRSPPSSNRLTPAARMEIFSATDRRSGETVHFARRQEQPPDLLQLFPPDARGDPVLLVTWGTSKP